MGKKKLGYNWRARSQNAGTVDFSQAKLLEGKLEGALKHQNGFEVTF